MARSKQIQYVSRDRPAWNEQRRLGEAKAGALRASDVFEGPSPEGAIPWNIGKAEHFWAPSFFPVTSPPRFGRLTFTNALLPSYGHFQSLFALWVILRVIGVFPGVAPVRRLFVHGIGARQPDMTHAVGARSRVLGVAYPHNRIAHTDQWHTADTTRRRVDCRRPYSSKIERENILLTCRGRCTPRCRTPIPSRVGATSCGK